MVAGVGACSWCPASRCRRRRATGSPSWPGRRSPRSPARPGFRRGHAGRAVDDPAEWVLVSEWDGVGAYRRALGTYEVKLAATPLLAQARDDAGAFEELVTAEPDGVSATAASDRAAGRRQPPDPDTRWGPAKRPGRFGTLTDRQPDGVHHGTCAADRIDTIVSLSKRRGFVYPSSEIYGGLRAAWDYGPLGVELKNNIKRQWWQSMVQGRDDVVGLDSSRHPGPRGLGGLRPRQRVHRPADRVPVLPQAVPRRPPRSRRTRRSTATPPENGLADITCPNCGNRGAFTEPKQFNGLLTHLPRPGRGRVRPGLPAPGDRAGHLHQLPATCCRPRGRSSPFGIGQIGKSFRNEITPGNFIFRTREFEQMEMEFFVKPGTDEEWHEYWIDERFALVHRPRHRQGQPAAATSTRRRSCRTTPSAPSTSSTGSTSPAREWGELEGIANRTDFDLTTHAKRVRRRTCPTSTRRRASAASRT